MNINLEYLPGLIHDLLGAAGRTVISAIVTAQSMQAPKTGPADAAGRHFLRLFGNDPDRGWDQYNVEFYQELHAIERVVAIREEYLEAVYEHPEAGSEKYSNRKSPSNNILVYLTCSVDGSDALIVRQFHTSLGWMIWSMDGPSWIIEHMQNDDVPSLEEVDIAIEDSV